MALFVTLIVALVIGQTLWDWRDAKRGPSAPRWLGALALTSLLAATLFGTNSMGSVLYQRTVGELNTGLGAGSFWAEAVFLFCGLGVIVAAVRKKSVRSLLLVAGVLSFALWLGVTLYA
ncbi:MAG TPA: hypothetical protein VGU63_03460 [Candidatus Acidoferrales bacterium]|nr:hypothetical protein [Candidatus Acidoferrales bacterium]